MDKLFNYIKKMKNIYKVILILIFLIILIWIYMSFSKILGSDIFNVLIIFLIIILITEFIKYAKKLK